MMPGEHSKLAAGKVLLGPGRRRPSPSGSVTLEAVTLDVTGTLIHCPGLAQIYADVLTRHGLTVTPGALRPQLEWAWKELSCRVDLRHHDRFSSHEGGARGFWRRYLERVCQLQGLEQPSRFAAAELFESLARADAWRVYPDVPATLVNLKAAGLKLAVISNWDERLPRLLESLGLSAHFETVVYSAEGGFEKPHASIFYEALRRLGSAPDATLHIGDNPRLDVEGAVAAGLRAAHIDRSQGQDLPSLLESSLDTSA